MENLNLDTKRDLTGYERCLVHPVNHLQYVAVDGGDNRDERPQRQLQKTVGFMNKTTALHVHHELYVYHAYYFFDVYCMTAT